MQTEARRAGSKEKTRGGEEDRPGLQERPEHLQCLDAESKETGGKPSVCTTANSRCQSWVTTEICALTQNLKKLEVSQAFALLQLRDVKAGLQQKYVRVC